MANPTTDSAMYTTIHRQPADLAAVLANPGWEAATAAAALLASARRVFCVGIGTSYHAALVAAWLLRTAGADARAVSSFDFAVYPANFPLTATDAIVLFAHTGTKHYSAQSLARATAAGATVVSVGSQAAEHPGSQLVLRSTPPETSAAYTSSHLTAMTIAAQIATVLGDEAGSAATTGWRDALAALPDLVAGVLAREDEIAPVTALAVAKQVYAAGASPNEATALELVIKAREAAYARVDALPVEQYLHGPLVSFTADDLAILIHVPGAAATRVAEVAAVLAHLGGTLWLVGAPVATIPDALVFTLPALPEDLSPLLAVVPMQVLAYQMAAAKGTHPDTFRTDDPQFLAAIRRLKL